MSYTRKLNCQKGKKLNYKIETIPCLSDNYAFVIAEYSEKKSIPIPKTGACSFVSPFSLGTSSNPPNVIQGLQK